MRFASTAFIGSGLANQNNIIQSGLVFDFKASDYVSGSTIWNAAVGNYTASVTGTVAGGLTYIDGTKVGFNGNQWLQFSNNMTASISSSQWNVYALVEFTNAQTASQAYTPSFFSKGTGNYPAWNWYYKGGSPFPTNEGFVIINGGEVAPGGGTWDTYNTCYSFVVNFCGSSKQLFGFNVLGSDTGSLTIPYVTPQWSTVVPGSSIIFNTANYGPNSFTGSAAEPLLFGKSAGGGQNISGSVVRLFAYNRNLTQAERQSNWIALTNSYV